MKTIQERAEESSKEYGPGWGDFTRKDTYEDGYVQGAKDERDLVPKFVKWIMDNSTGSIGEQHMCKDLAYIHRGGKDKDMGNAEWKKNIGFTTEELYEIFLKEQI